MYTVRSYQIAQSVNVRNLRENYEGELLFSDSDELFYKLEDKKFVYIFQFGIVSYFNVDEDEVKSSNDLITTYSKGIPERILTEDMNVIVANSELSVSFDAVYIPEINEEMIRLIMLHTSQSVALDRYSEITSQLMEETAVHTGSLELLGRLTISKNKLKKVIGRTLNIKNGIYENLYIFESPEVVWQDETLDNLDRELKSVFDLKNRYRNLQDRINIIKENLDLFRDIWDHKESSTLEWIIIILIFVEIIDLFITKLF